MRDLDYEFTELENLLRFRVLDRDSVSIVSSYVSCVCICSYEELSSASLVLARTAVEDFAIYDPMAADSETFRNLTTRVD